MKRTLFSTIALGALLALSASISLAQGGLMVNPKRLVFDDRKRIDNVMLFNSGNDTTSYIISLLHYIMQPDGSFKEIPDSVNDYRATYCDSMVRFFPLAVTLAPHESQMIHVRYMKPQGLAAGEYRSHLYFRGLDRAKAIEQTALDTSKHEISLSLRPIFGLSIPLICRNATTPATVTMDGAAVSGVDTAGNITITAKLHRSGNESCYGSLVAKYVKPNGSDMQVGIAKGLAVYTPLDTRAVSITFKLPEGIDPKQGAFRLEYQTLTDNPTEKVLASQEITSIK